MKVKVVSPFQDIITKEKRNIEEVIEVTKERAKDLIDRNLAVEFVEEIIEPVIEEKFKKSKRGE